MGTAQAGGLQISCPTRRDDVSQIYFKKTMDQDLGFDIQFPYERGQDYYLVICGDGRRGPGKI